MNRIFLLLFILAAWIPLGVFGQTELVGSVVHTKHTFTSSVLKEERSLLVRVPQGYEKNDTRYPVVYMLDGHVPNVNVMASIIEQQAWGKQMPEMILVSIQNTNRSRDFTPTDDGKGGTVGGGRKFLTFMKDEVIPFVETNYRTQPYRIFAGHSLGGLAVISSIFMEPGLFNAYIAASPDLNYDDEYAIKQFERFLGSEKRSDAVLFVALGDEPNYRDSFKSFQNLLEKRKPKALDFKFREMPEENHSSEILRAFYWGLRLVFRGWVMPEKGSVSDLENHFKILSKRYGYEILIPELTLNRIGYQLMGLNRMPEAIDVFKKNVKNYPESSNVYDSLGEAYEKKGEFQLAKDNYEKAYRLAIRSSDEKLASIFKKNLDRVSEKIR